MTFSQEVKNEIFKSLRNVKGCCAASFLRAVLKSIGSLSLENKKFYFSLESDNHDLLVLCKRLAEEFLSCQAKIESYNVNVKGAAVYSCDIYDNVGDKVGLTYRDKDNALQLSDNALLIPEIQCCKRSFLQGLFVSCGSVAIPVSDSDVGENKLSSKYHLELRFSDEKFAQTVVEGYSEFEFKTTARKNYTVLYIKDSGKIADFLTYVNVTKGRLKLENVIIGRSMRNAANRQSNCISANIDKAVAAAERQLNAIAVLKQTGKYEQLAPQLKQIAVLREQNPEATLDEIAEKLNISKSGANHRLSKITELANLQEIK